MKSHAELAEMGDNMKWVEDFGPRHIGEVQVLPVNAVLLALATFVAIERFGPHAF